MTARRITLLLGGNFHDLAGFEATVVPFLQAEGYEVQATRDFDSLLSLSISDTDVVMLYTCLNGTENGDLEGRDFSAEQTSALSSLVVSGCGLLALHAATVSGSGNKEKARLLGGAFVSHPPDMLSFTVTPVEQQHPIIDGIEAFEVFDEFYIERHDDSVDIHMTAGLDGDVYPMVWSRSEGKGKVVHIAPGHDQRTWNVPAYRKLLLQSMSWLMPRSNQP